jgi:hypothetical protein
MKDKGGLVVSIVDSPSVAFTCESARSCLWNVNVECL